MVRSNKKSPEPIINQSEASLFYPRDYICHFLPKTAIQIQAGLLTFVSYYLLHLPIWFYTNSGIIAMFVHDYSGGPVLDFHECSLLSFYKAPEMILCACSIYIKH